MHLPRALPCVLVLGLAFAEAAAQSVGYEDADNSSQAVGMMATNLAMHRSSFTQCSTRFPEFEEEMYRNYRKWEEEERSVIRKARYHWAQMTKRGTATPRDDLLRRSHSST